MHLSASLTLTSTTRTFDASTKKMLPAVGVDGKLHPAPEPRIEVPLEQIWRLHDVHVAVDEPEPVFHDALLA